jgi:Xaa-Pro aminopeptidase
MAMSTVGRLAGLRGKLDEKGIDALLVSHPHNRRYLSGFTGSAGYLLITTAEAVIATDFRYFEQAEEQAAGFRLHRLTQPPAETWLPGLLAGLGGKRVGIEAEHLPYAVYKRFAKVVADIPQGERPRLAATTGLVEGLRAVKEPEEIAAIQAAVDLGDAAFAQLAERLEPGWTEREAAWEVEKYMREHGGEAVSFETIVAGGAWGAMPHAFPRDRQLQAGEAIVVDLGVRRDGYCSDLTRTLFLGEPDDQFRRVYDIVLGAQLAALELIEAGMTGGQAHLLAHRVIAEAGYSEEFGHGLGHGVGLEVHEAPRLGRDSSDALTDGMVMTIEPGIYIKGWGGVRIEDLTVMENGRLRVLTRAPKTEQTRA